MKPRLGQKLKDNLLSAFFNPELFFRISAPILLVIFAVFLAGCTTVPTQHFSDYKETFNKARAASEQVLLDYGVAKAEIKALEAALKLSGENSTEQVNARRQEEFNVIEATSLDASINHIAVRIKAWDVVGRYNEVLTALAEGRSASEAAGLVDGLYQNLASFPFESIGQAASEAVPFIGALKTLLNKAQNEWSRREFIRVVTEGGPWIRSLFIESLKADTENFYNIRFLLNDSAYQDKLDEIVDLAQEFYLSAKRCPINTAAEDLTLTKLAEQTNTILRQVPRLLTGDEDKDSEILIPKEIKGAKTYSNCTHRQFVELKDKIRTATTQAAKINQKLEAYKKTLVAYIKLLNIMSENLRTLEKAANDVTTVMPSIDRFLAAYIELRQAYDTFKRKE